ncbi:MAG: D-alanine--D-alanine ligase [Ruminococcaceae bacterium]|nr:D-alanine--D-alanine ligase [Oscillospiraceae bacterium]
MADKVMVLFGGVSTEYIVSLRSAYNIISGLRESGYQVIPVGITPDGTWLRYLGPDEHIRDDRWSDQAWADARTGAGSGCAVRSPRDFILSVCGCRPDVIFPAVHGINCEDGTLQGLLSLSGIPYVGCGVLASAACMDKQHARRIFRDAGIPQCRYLAVSRREIERSPQMVAAHVQETIGFPCFLKPSNGGSSVGTCRVATADELADALRDVSRYDQTVLVEAFVTAREIEVAVLGLDKPVTGAIGEVVTGAETAYYDYEAKYFSEHGATVVVPAELDEKTQRMIRQYALKAHLSIGCRGMARVDFFLDKTDGTLYINEINTLPGFTSISIFPKAFEAAGLPLSELVHKLCRMAIREQKNSKRLETI